MNRFIKDLQKVCGVLTIQNYIKQRRDSDYFEEGEIDEGDIISMD
jgi:hypothetical protein